MRRSVQNFIGRLLSIVKQKTKRWALQHGFSVRPAISPNDYVFWQGPEYIPFTTIIISVLVRGKQASVRSSVETVLCSPGLVAGKAMELAPMYQEG